MRPLLVGLGLLGCAAWAGDAARGEALYTARCGACHSLGENGAGPQHKNLWGRGAATQPGFDYSPALKASKLVWTEPNLERWLADPNALVPGNRMAVQLVDDPQDRADVLAYLKQATSRADGSLAPQRRPRGKAGSPTGP